MNKESIRPLAVGAREAARAIAVCPRTLHTLTKTGQINAARVGRKLLYSVIELERFLDARTRQGGAE